MLEIREADYRTLYDKAVDRNAALANLIRKVIVREHFSKHTGQRIDQCTDPICRKACELLPDLK